MHFARRTDINSLGAACSLSEWAVASMASGDGRLAGQAQFSRVKDTTRNDSASDYPSPKTEVNALISADSDVARPAKLEGLTLSTPIPKQIHWIVTGP